MLRLCATPAAVTKKNETGVGHDDEKCALSTSVSVDKSTITSSIFRILNLAQRVKRTLKTRNKSLDRSVPVRYFAIDTERPDEQDVPFGSTGHYRRAVRIGLYGVSVKEQKPSRHGTKTQDLESEEHGRSGYPAKESRLND